MTWAIGNPTSNYSFMPKKGILINIVFIYMFDRPLDIVEYF